LPWKEEFAAAGLTSHAREKLYFIERERRNAPKRLL